MKWTLYSVLLTISLSGHIFLTACSFQSRSVSIGAIFAVKCISKCTAETSKKETNKGSWVVSWILTCVVYILYSLENFFLHVLKSHILEEFAELLWKTGFVKRRLLQTVLPDVFLWKACVRLSPSQVWKGMVLWFWLCLTMLSCPVFEECGWMKEEDLTWDGGEESVPDMPYT